VTEAVPADTGRAPHGKRPAQAGHDAVAAVPGALRAGRRGGGWTTRRWLTVGVCASMTVLIVLGIVGGWVLARSTRISDRLVDVSTPALVDAVRLESALTDQETGTRGYGLTGQTSFLDPYHSGLQNEQKAVGELRVLLPDDDAARADLTRLLARAEVWQTRFGRPVAAAPPGAPVALATERADEGKAEFDAVRTASLAVEKTLQIDGDRGRADLSRVRSQRNWIFSAIAAIILALTVLIFVGLRRGVTAPLKLLSDDVRTVTDGDFEHEVAAVGPADLRLLAQDVDAMRARLSDELAFSKETGERLDEQAADLQRSNAELEQFAYVASHDLQEPLRKVASFCQLLQRRYADQLDDRAEQYIGYAVDGATRMQTLINDLLAFSRVGRLNTGAATVDLDELFRRTSDALSIAVEESGATVTHDPLPTVTGDPTQLGIIVQNLLSNALKFRSPERRPEVSVTVRGADGMWHFAVADNGIGIPAGYADKVFVIFQRLHTRDAYPGNGIGLALCKKIVEFHGGTIGIDLEHAPGTRITFTLPQIPETAHSPETAQGPETTRGEGAAQVPEAARSAEAEQGPEAARHAGTARDTLANRMPERGDDQ
jgi:signal transduction histidine kinase